MLKTKERGGVVAFQDHAFPERQGFSVEDIIWAVGIWSVILTLTPAIAFYLLMVA
ncbi:MULTISPECIES: hypothetical protein [Bradyrhizobium]|jgi:hypothetical protein|uniref:Uncharacterized protein n=1 Tax=Bradyrhizobium aeschynomenes TaxID=2734909 RepID=A0ABX2CBD5_9BRAD|nr:MULTISPECIES: hypothetical protein [Bradyrhizobium]NPU14940.1 hypothetical protein [Bradyrhizobium aeschynomenes]NPU64790.1 hypothetical protein [Bradyrhizobium aeschynomenes]NPV24442.1 hypothetical protein [Bradyrhizobium aeschynomenes]